MKHFEQRKTEHVPEPHTPDRPTNVIFLRDAVRDRLNKQHRGDEFAVDHHELLNERAGLLKQQEQYERDRIYEQAHEYEQVMQEAAHEQAQYEDANARFQETESLGAIAKFFSSSLGERALLQQRMNEHKVKYKKILAYADKLKPAVQEAALKRTALAELTASINEIDQQLDTRRSRLTGT